jgi:nitroimidazol reductase NimA-like FMN-containing flavoprotein (pyridoxamine 5'-phosphate oxidase superfamily)
MKAKYHTDLMFIEELIGKCEVCSLAMTDPSGMPYVIPMNFGYERGYIYFHSAGHGKKIEALEHNPAACVSFSADHKLYRQSENVACSYGMKYKSVIARGMMEFIEDFAEKEKALNFIMKQYSDRSFIYNAPAVRNVKIFRLRISEITGKEFGHLYENVSPDLKSKLWEK